MVYRDPITSLFDLKEIIEGHVRNIPQFMLISTVEHALPDGSKQLRTSYRA